MLIFLSGPFWHKIRKKAFKTPEAKIREHFWKSNHPTPPPAQFPTTWKKERIWTIMIDNPYVDPSGRFEQRRPGQEDYAPGEHGPGGPVAHGVQHAEGDRGGGRAGGHGVPDGHNSSWQSWALAVFSFEKLLFLMQIRNCPALKMAFFWAETTKTTSF